MAEHKVLTRTTVRQSFSHVLRNERGSQTVEFSISIMIFMTMIFAIIEFSRAIYSYEFLSYAAQEGARFAMVRGWESTESNCGTSAPPSFTLKFSCIAQQADVQNYVKSLTLPLINQSNVTATYTSLGKTPDGATAPCSNPNNAYSKGCLVKVTVNYSFGFIAPFMPKNSSSFSGASEKVIQQ